MASLKIHKEQVWDKGQVDLPNTKFNCVKNHLLYFHNIYYKKLEKQFSETLNLIGIYVEFSMFLIALCPYDTIRTLEYKSFEVRDDVLF